MSLHDVESRYPDFRVTLVENHKINCATAKSVAANPPPLANRSYCNSVVFKVIFDTIPSSSVLSNYIYVPRRGYQIECHLLRIEIRKNSDFMGILNLSRNRLGKPCFFSFLFLLSTDKSLDFDNFLIKLAQ